MSNIFKSGAFLQQCFSVHPLSLSFKMLSLPDKIGILCQNCKMRHRLTIGPISRIVGDSERCDSDAGDALQRCSSHHQDTLQVTEVSVERDIVQFRCRACKAGFQVTVRLYETYQP